MVGFPLFMLLIFALTLFCSATLLFMIQPLVGKLILPLLGGTPEVWNTCMLFFQTMLLAGYLYSHLSTKYLGTKKQTILHMILLLIPFIFLPLSVNRSLIQGGINPVPGVLLLLLFSVGVPFFVISTSAPLLQKWFSSTDHPSARDPYFLYTSSNLGSMLALIGYPAIIEPSLRLGEQTFYWTIGYGLLVLLIGCCVYCLWRATPGELSYGYESPAQGNSSGAGSSTSSNFKESRSTSSNPRDPESVQVRQKQDQEEEDELPGQKAPVTMGRRLKWILLGAVPSSLMLGVTTYITTDIAAIPLLWVLPLALYLLSFIIVFAKVSHRAQAWIVALEALVVFCIGMTRVHPLVADSSNDMVHAIFWTVALALFVGCLAILWLRDGQLNHKAMILALPLLLLLVIFMMLSEIKPGILDTIALHLLTLFVVAMVCHGELAHDRPAPEYLTEFFLLMSVGGVVGGLFNALIAPLIFNSLAEYKVAMIVACLLLPPLLNEEKPTRFAVFIDMALCAVFFLTGLGLILIRLFENGLENSGLDFSQLLESRNQGGLWLTIAAIVGAGAWGFWRTIKPGEDDTWMNRLFDLLMPACLLVLVFGLILGCDSNMVSTRIRSLSSLEYVPISFSRLRLILMFGLPAILCYTCVERSVRFGLCVGALLLGAAFSTLFEEDILLQKRSFFGVLVVQKGIEDAGNYVTLLGRSQQMPTHRLTHGTTLHGKQFLDPEFRRTPLTYYHRTGPIGQIMELYNGGSFKPRTEISPNATMGLLPLTMIPDGTGISNSLAMALNSVSWGIIPADMPNIAVIGLGTGTMSCYAEEGQKFFFYDIDPLVRDIAQNPKYFTFWSDAKERGAKLQLFINDARLEIERQVSANAKLAREGKPPVHDLYKVLVVDAFSSDAIPIHLITKEALQLYLQMMQEDGIVCFHISNRYLNLEPVLARLAEELNLVAYINGHDRGSRRVFYTSEIYEVTNPGKTDSSWVMLARDKSYLDRLWKDTLKIQEQKRAFTRIRKMGTGSGVIASQLFPLSLIPDPTGLSTSVGMALNGACGAESPWLEANPYLYKEGTTPRKISTWTDDFSDLLSIFSW